MTETTLQRICRTCKKSFPDSGDFFSKDPKVNRGYSTQCKSCHNAKVYAWDKAHPENKRERKNRSARKCGPAKRRALKIEVFSHYCRGVPECACCQVGYIEFLGIDHINGGGTKHRREGVKGNYFYSVLKKQGYPEGYRVLCHNCNMSLGFFGYCPHRR